MYMKMIRYILAAVSLMMAFAGASAQTEQALQQQFANELKAMNAEVRTISSSFVQYRSMAVLVDVVEKEGDFRFMAPGNILLAFDDGDYIKIGEKKFEMKTAGQVVRTNVSSNPMLKRLGVILSSCMSGDIAKMAQGFDIELVHSDKEWKAVLLPQNSRVSAKLSRILIIFDRGDMSLKELMMEEASGDYTRYVFHDKEFNAEMDSRLFEF